MCKGLKLLQSLLLPDKLDSIDGILENLEVAGSAWCMLLALEVISNIARSIKLLPS